MPRRSVRSAVLESFRLGPIGLQWTVSDLASRLSCHQSTVRRHLSSLLAEGVVVELDTPLRLGDPGRPEKVYELA